MRRGAVAGALLVLVLALFVGGPLLASTPSGNVETEGAGTGEHHEAPKFLGLPQWVFLVANLVIFFGVLAWAAGPALVRFLEDKQREIGHAVAQADRQRDEVHDMEARIAAQIAELRREVDELGERSAREGERERQEILADAARERERISSSVQAEIDQGLRSAKQQLTAHAAKLAAELAGERLERGLTREDRKRLFRDNLQRLERKEA